ncbi:MAG: viral A-type inclusion protein [Citrobacter freundii]|nr:MAG: viral A-type inclusion protein [Citrobacter freundii]
MKLISLLLTASTVLLFSCGNNNAPAKSAEQTLSDSLFDQVMDGHNVGMAKMPKLTDAKKKAQIIIDSIQKLPAKAQQAAAPLLTQIDSLKKQLDYAEFAMNKWMDEINIDSANNDLKKRIQYLTDEKDKVNKVKTAILASLQKADSLLKR